MSEVSEEKATAWYPAQFPPQGRLPTQAAMVGENCHQQDSQEHLYRQELCLAANKRVEPPCCKTLHTTLPVRGTRPAGRHKWRSDLLPANLSACFFEGTGNNLNNDRRDPCCSQVNPR
jgi:hypothetical protein